MDWVVLAIEVGKDIVLHIIDSVRNGRHEEIRKLADVWPAPIKSRLALLEGEAKAREAVNGG